MQGEVYLMVVKIGFGERSPDGCVLCGNQHEMRSY